MPGELSTPIEGQALIYATADGTVRVEVIYQDETFWLSQRRMAELFGVDVRTVSEHLQNVFGTGELVEGAVIRKSRIAAADGKHYVTKLYNLDAVISVGYRVNSRQATQFRIWATQTLKEFIVKGFVLDEFLAVVDPTVGQRTRYLNLQNAVGRDQATRLTRGLYASNLGAYRDRAPNPLLVASKCAPDALPAYHSALEGTVSVRTRLLGEEADYRPELLFESWQMRSSGLAETQ